MKRQLKSRSCRDIYHGDEAFENEIKAYSIVLPILARISPTQELPYPSCLYSGPDSNHNALIVLEDLKESGYCIANRLKSLNYHQCRSVFRKFAHLHATSMVLRIVDVEGFQRVLASLNDYIFSADTVNSFPTFFDDMVVRCLKSLRRNSPEKGLQEAIAFIERHFSDRQLFEIARRMVLREKDPNLMAVCHGDSWLNNFMFKSLGEEDPAQDVKFLDLQVMRYTSPTIDLLHFLYSSTDTLLRKQYYDDLMGDYQTALLQSIDTLADPYLDKEEVRSGIGRLKSLHTLEQIKERMHRHSIYGLAQFILLLPVFTFPLDMLTNAEVNGEEPEEFHRRLRETVLEFFENGVLKEVLLM